VNRDVASSFVTVGLELAEAIASPCRSVSLNVVVVVVPLLSCTAANSPPMPGMSRLQVDPSDVHEVVEEKDPRLHIPAETYSYDEKPGYGNLLSRMTPPGQEPWGLEYEYGTSISWPPSAKKRNAMAK
jgi:hypothetical protein